jgi:Helix-turn-helix domain
MSYAAIQSVLDHSNATGGARLLMLTLAHHVNKTTGRCDPAIATLARECKATTRTINRQLAQLAAADEIEVVAGGGRHRCNQYRLKLPQNPDASVRVSEQETLTPVSEFKAETLTKRARNPDAGVTQTYRTYKKVRKTAHQSLEAEEFAEFWKAYPKRTAKAKALKAWRASHKDRPPIATLLEILAKHAAGWDDVKFIPHPATWLNGHRWEDELNTPAPAAGRRSSL